ncbi:hypothetical protein [Candidatus Spyradosoma sp. SGI.093]|uniref:hypothetical protein n=1 Tax=Candidatus Spyradosoma sp. SGI.093 TaxID=3420583 RepID=UPI003D0439AF
MRTILLLAPAKSNTGKRSAAKTQRSVRVPACPPNQKTQRTRRKPQSQKGGSDILVASPKSSLHKFFAADFFLKPQSQRKLKKGEATFLSLHRNPSAQTSLLFYWKSQKSIEGFLGGGDMAPRFAYLSLHRNPLCTNFLPQMTQISADFLIHELHELHEKEGKRLACPPKSPKKQTSL